MQYIAEAKNLKISPRKARLVVDSVKKYSITQVLAALSSLNKRAAHPIKKVLESAVANAVNNSKADKANLVIKEFLVNEGIKYKRYHYAARGRVRPYKKRTSNVRVVLSTKEEKTDT